MRAPLTRCLHSTAACTTDCTTGLVNTAGCTTGLCAVWTRLDAAHPDTRPSEPVGSASLRVSSLRQLRSRAGGQSASSRQRVTLVTPPPLDPPLISSRIGRHAAQSSPLLIYCSYNMRQGLRNGPESVHLSVPSINRCSNRRWVC